MRSGFEAMGHVLRLRGRLLLMLAVVGVLGATLPVTWVPHALTRWLLAWDIGVALYVALATVMMWRSSHSHMRQRARQIDERGQVILAFVVVSAIASLAAIGGELSLARQLHGAARSAHVALAGATVFIAWAFNQLMFTLHYAHQYYAALEQGSTPGLAFPQDDAPDYADFFYFAAVIGTSAQTADVSIVSKAMRRTVTLHCVLAFAFNTTVLALLVNIGASLI